MNHEEARRILWLKSNPRPLGELLDEGYLTQERLEWAAQCAYNNKLKEAAHVLLDSLKTPAPRTEEKAEATQEPAADSALPINITLEKARTTPWPFPPYKGQLMGMLVDTKQLSLKDLGYAVENAWDEKVRQASIALSLVRLEQVVKEPAPSTGFVNIVSGGRSFSEKRQSVLTLIQGAILGIFITLAFAFLIVTINNSKPHPNAEPITEFISTPTGILALALVLGFFIFIGWLGNFILDQTMKRLDKQIEAYRFGQEGEEKVVQLIVQALDGNWQLFRNIQIPGRNKADLDLVLVGPPGIWVMEVKNFNGIYRNIGEDWEYRKGKNWKNASGNPSRQANNNSLRLKNFLKADNINVYVTPTVIWANPESPLTIENPTVAVWLYNNLPDELGNIWQGEKLSKAERDKVSEKLSKLCTQQKREKQSKKRG